MMNTDVSLILGITVPLLLVSCAGAPPASPKKLAAPGALSSFDDSAPPKFLNASVHDPSVFPAEDGFYVIGSHLAAAKTTDFIQWTQVTTDWHNRPNMFYPKDNPDGAIQKMEDQIADVMRGKQNTQGFFAGDIHRMPNGKFYQYYSLTTSWKCSAIGLAIADTVGGPYITQGLLLRSAEAGENRTPDGTDTWTSNKYPNCIDSQAFFDNNGKFWLVYGSWSGGIFLLEMDSNTGMPLAGSRLNAENHGYGRRLIRNAHTSVEGPYILYSPETQYYYLFTSFGGLASDGGYNIRLFRSKNPDGPYEDATGKHRNVGENLSVSKIQDYGVKIMGSYQFMHESGESGSGTTGYLSPGHNSARYDPDTGKYLMIYHQRFTGRGEAHQIRVNELFLNEDGWFAAAPFRYDGGTVRSFTANQLTGSWKIINHSKYNNPAPEESKTCRFHEGGAVTGQEGESAGTWELGSDGKTARITVDGVLYKGVFLRCWDEDNKMWGQAFTALSEEGIALWGAGAAVK